ncbi:SIMPL domain-containing protein [Amycolatopsis sp. NPDC021455]|uniref:SIMPL domain-containing protein n=1 Tax=Amycolatopsis sp. NPDC021455 TaxID=3154901 RepID=UPI003409D874
MQMIERPWGVTVHGAASVKAAPDLVRARFKVVCLEQKPSDAFESAGMAVHEIRSTLRRHDVPDAGVESSRIELRGKWEYGQQRKFLGYESSASFVVESAALDDLPSLLTDLVSAGANEIEGVDFDIRDKPALRARARREAVAAARAKAELYAEAAGVRLGAVVHIDDVDPEEKPQYRGHGAGGAATAEDLAPGHVVVSAAVVLGFGIVPA